MRVSLDVARGFSLVDRRRTPHFRQLPAANATPQSVLPGVTGPVIYFRNCHSVRRVRDRKSYGWFAHVRFVLMIYCLTVGYTRVIL